MSRGQGNGDEYLILSTVFIVLTFRALALRQRKSKNMGCMWFYMVSNGDTSLAEAYRGKQE